MDCITSKPRLMSTPCMILLMVVLKKIGGPRGTTKISGSCALQVKRFEVYTEMKGTRADCITSNKEDAVLVLRKLIVWMLTSVLRSIRAVFQLVLKAMLFLECGAVIVKNYIASKLSTAVKSSLNS